MAEKRKLTDRDKVEKRNVTCGGKVENSGKRKKQEMDSQIHASKGKCRRKE